MRKRGLVFVVLAAILTFLSWPCASQRRSPADTGAPQVTVSHSAGKWTLAGRKNTVELNESDFAVGVHAADDPVVPPGHARPFIPLHFTAAHKVILHHLDTETFQQFQDIFIVKTGFLLVFCIKRIHKLVEPAPRRGALRNHAPGKPERLHRLAECSGGLTGYAVAYLSYHFQFVFTGCVGFFSRHIPGQISVAAGQAHQGFINDNYRPEKICLFNVLRTEVSQGF